jgi:acetyl-CoA carboxylase biotin carboxyl carrier protein
MFKMHEIRELIKLVDQSTILEFELESEGTKVNIKKSGGVTTGARTEVAHPSEVAAQPAAVETVTGAVGSEPTPSAAAAPVVENKDTDNLHKIVSPMVGTFYSSPSPDTKAYVGAGDPVSEKTVVCIVEAMKLMNEIEAEVRGQIVQVLVENGQLVEYGQPLFLVKAE